MLGTVVEWDADQARWKVLGKGQHLLMNLKITKTTRSHQKYTSLALLNTFSNSWKVLGEGRMGSALMGSPQTSVVFDGGTFRVLPLTCFYLPKSARVYPKSVKFTKSNQIPRADRRMLQACLRQMCVYIYIYIYTYIYIDKSINNTYIYIYIYIYI